MNIIAQMNFKAITLKSEKGPFWDIITEAGVSRPVEDIYHQPSGLITFWTTCLWDTGATHSAITKATASALGLVASGEAKIVYGSGAAITKFYTIALTLPNLLFVPEIWVTESDTDDGFGIILGMDVICMGDFAITNVGGVTTFSFCVPSLETIDFVQRIAGFEGAE